ncbi:MAG: hypothetical protein BWY09_01341 [Candidatus Hydrogenedentes bacterium ADurb.Bin179]|nr:MAG: hypothetical protein BWY09_01341 [Candidatus Hydrogenedentes bacterium ADurb.Bin179]
MVIGAPAPFLEPVDAIPFLRFPHALQVLPGLFRQLFDCRLALHGRQLAHYVQINIKRDGILGKRVLGAQARNITEEIRFAFIANPGNVAQFMGGHKYERGVGKPTVYVGLKGEGYANAGGAVHHEQSGGGRFHAPGQVYRTTLPFGNRVLHRPRHSRHRPPDIAVLRSAWGVLQNDLEQGSLDLTQLGVGNGSIVKIQPCFHGQAGVAHAPEEQKPQPDNRDNHQQPFWTPDESAPTGHPFHLLPVNPVGYPQCEED